MKISEASDDELNQFIAGSIEDRPVKRGVDYIYDADKSSMGAWVYSRHFIPPGWKPRDFINTGDGLKMMMDRANLLTVFYSGVADAWVAMKTIVINAGEVLPKGQWFVKAQVIGERLSINKNIGRAISEAFALMNGWQE